MTVFEDIPDVPFNDRITVRRTRSKSDQGDTGWSIADISWTRQDSGSWSSASAIPFKTVMTLRGALRNSPATGTVSVAGTAAVGQTLTATVSGVEDLDGLTSPTYSHQWVRVDADGTSNPVDIPGATSSSYTLTAADRGKKVKVRVSFNDDLGNAETLTSAAHPTTGTVPAVSPGAPTALGATAVATTSGVLGIDLSWTEPADDGGADITGYRIEQSPNGTTNWQDVIADTGTGATTYRDTGTGTTGLAPETTRHYRVSAINSAGTGPPSTVDSATTAAKVTVGIEHATYATTEETGSVDICALVTSPSGGAPFEVEVYLTTEDGTATAPADYQAFTGRGLSFSINALSACTRLGVNQDDLLEDDETLSVGMSVDGAGAGLGFGTERTEVTITDEDTAQVSLQGPSTAAEGTAATFVVSLAPAAPFDVTVEYAATGGTATGGTDYTATSGTLTFPAATAGTRRSFEVPILADGTADPDETFQIRLSLPAGQAHADRIEVPATAHTVTIADGLQPPAGLVAVPGDRQVTLSWNDPADSTIAGYQFRVSDDAGSTWRPGWTTIAGSGAATTSHVVGNLTAGFSHVFQVRSLRGTEVSRPAVVSATPTGPPAPPRAPRNLIVAPRDRGLSVYWTKPVEDPRAPVTAYRVRWRPAGTSQTPTEESRSAGDASISDLIVGLMNGADYEVQVAAVNSAGTGLWATAVATPQPPSQPPPQLGLPEINVGTLSAHWTDAPDSDTWHPDTAPLNINSIGGDCTGDESFKVLWKGPGDLGTFEANPPAAEWDAHVIAKYGADTVSYRFRDEFGSTRFVAMYATVTLNGSAYLTVRIRGRFEGQGWGAWSPPVGLYCWTR